MTRWMAAIALAGLAACSREQGEKNEAAPRPTATHPVPQSTSTTGTAELPAPELEGTAIASGSWRFQVSADGDQAVFGDAGQPSEFSIRCDPGTGRIVFSRAGPAGKGMMHVVAREGAAAFTTRAGAAGRIEATDSATDTFLANVLADATDRIGVKIGDAPTFAMPTDPVIGQTIRRCAVPRG